jgi:hypothetical protein
MSCIALNAGIQIGCGTNAGGLQKIWVTDQENIDVITASGSVITGITMASSTEFYEFEFNRNSASFTENLQVDNEAGSAFYLQEIMMKIGKRETTKRNILKLLVRRKLGIIALDANGIYWLLGEVDGMLLEELNSSSGQAKSDGSFYEFKFVAEEVEPAQEVQKAAVDAVI